MQIKTILAAAASAALVSAQTAQNQSLAAVLNSTSQLSTLNSILHNHTDILTRLTNLTNITIFAPTNDALAPLLNSSSFANLSSQPGYLADFLLYHVINGSYPASSFSTTPRFLRTYLNDTKYANVTPSQRVEALTVGQNVSLISGQKSVANVTTANVNVTNGIVHIINNYLRIPSKVSDTALAGGLTSLAGALNATNLTSTINNAQNITIFAPNNAAFASIANILSTLTAAQAASVLKYHVLNGTVAYSSQLSNTTNLTTAAGTPLNITVANGSVFVNAARVINADILVSGGVIHVLDSVLNPNSTHAANVSATAPYVAYQNATSASAAPYTSGVVATTTNTALLRTTSAVASGYSAAASGTATGTSASAAASSKAASSTSSKAAAAVQTAAGAMGAAALFGGAAFFANL